MDCCPYEVRESDKFGRYLVASRDLHPRETIICEEPLISGPLDEPGGNLMCLGCCSKMTQDMYNRCSKCHFPVCSSSCERVSEHSDFECGLFIKNGVSYPPPYTLHIMNKSILIVRCLVLKRQDPIKYDQLMTMSDNKDSRRNRPNCITADGRILENFQRYFPKSDFDPEEVLKLSGIIDINAHSFPVKLECGNTVSRVHIYNKTTLIAHSCSPNASWSPGIPPSASASASSPPTTSTSNSTNLKTSSTVLEIKTNRAVAAGEMLTVAYDDSTILYGTLRRLLPMEISGMFICHCVRCLDPTEFGSYLSGIKCLKCPEGYILSDNPVDSFSDWHCSSCGNMCDEITVSEIIDEAEDIIGFPRKGLLEEPDEHPDLLRQFICTFSGEVLHPNHYILMEANLRLVRSECFLLDELELEGLEEFLGRCERILNIWNVIIPGISEYRAFLLYHFSRGLVQLEERKLSNSKNSTRISSIKKDAQKDVPRNEKDDQESLKVYHRILEMQQEVLDFLIEKFTIHKRIDDVEKAMGKVRHRIGLLEGKTITRIPRI